MKHLVVLLALAALILLGSAALAEPIPNASDSVPVTVYIAPWVWVDIAGENGINIDVEAGVTDASGFAPLTFGANDHAHIVSSFAGSLPAGVTVAASLKNVSPTSGDANYYYYIANSELCLNYLGGAGTFAGDLAVDVSGVDITDRAGLYSGTATATIFVW